MADNPVQLDLSAHASWPRCAQGYGPGDHHYESGWCHDRVTALGMSEGPLLSKREYQDRDLVNAWRGLRDAMVTAARLPQIVGWLSRRLFR